MDAGMLAPVVGMADNALGVMDNVATTVGDDVVETIAHSGPAATNPFSLAPLVLDDVTVAASRADEAAGRIRTLI